jgi:hypothetical protein
MRTSIGLVTLLLAGASGVRANLFDVLFPVPELQVITVTDVGPGWTPLRAPTEAHPVYYLPVCVGLRDFGGVIAGDKEPKKQDMIRVIAKVLAKQGYVPADATHRPALMILFAWGTLYPQRFMQPGWPTFQYNYGQILRFLGGAKMNIPEADAHFAFPDIEGLTFSTPEQQTLREAAGDSFYVAKIAAYDLKPGAKGKVRALWTTRISGFARRRAMVDSLPSIVMIGGPNVGVDTPRPVWTRASEHFKAEVILGEPKLEEFLDSNKLPVVDLSAVRVTMGD